MALLVWKIIKLTRSRKRRGWCVDPMSHGSQDPERSAKKNCVAEKTIELTCGVWRPLENQNDHFLN